MDSEQVTPSPDPTPSPTPKGTCENTLHIGAAHPRTYAGHEIGPCIDWTPQPTDAVTPLIDKLVSPNGMDGSGPVPDKVTAAAKRLAKLRVQHLTGQPFTATQLQQLFDASAIQAEWMRELYEARDALTERLHTVERERTTARDQRDESDSKRIKLEDNFRDYRHESYEKITDLTQQRDRYAAALREHAKPLGEWDMLWVAPDGTMPGRVADAPWARAHIDALLAALEENDDL